MKIRNLVLSALLVTAAPVALADAVSQAQDTLDRYHQAFENRTSDLEQIENQVFGYQNKLEQAQTDLSTAQKDLADAQQAQANAKINLIGEASQDNERALKLADHALKMAERGVRTRTKREERTQTKLAELMEEKTRISSQLAADETRIAQQEEQLSKAKRQADAKAADLLAAAERAKRDAQARMEAQKLQADAVAERLAAIDAEREAQAAQAAKIEAEKPAPVAEKKELSELDKEALAYAQKEVARLENLLADGNPGRPTFKRLALGGNKIDSQPFSFLGQNQYRVETKVTNGRQIFQIGKHKFRRTIPAADDGEEYVFIFDAKRPSRPRLVMYKKALLENI
ncbi:MAG: hypothetical protein ACRBBW_20980 [Cellvibrionaceae bacterium]